MELGGVRRQSVYNILHGEPDNPTDQIEVVETHDYDEDRDDDLHDHKSHSKHAHKKEVVESFDFNDVESMMWRKVSFNVL